MKNAKNAKVAKRADDDFIPAEVASGSSSYFKIGQGDNKVRIISHPVAGWLEWVDKQPVRTTLADGEPEASDDENPPKQFIAMAVIDQEDGNVKIWEITQKSIMKSIRQLTNNPDWGQPFGYDLNIEKKGDGLKTKYTVTPSPKKPLSKEAIKKAGAKPCALENLFEGEDPWDVDGVKEVTEYHFK